jgi:FkbM family methyltransferase
MYYGLIKKEFFILNLKNGYRLKIRTNSTDFYAFVNVWIVEEYKKEGFEINKDDTIIDIGGHIGIFSIYAAQFCKDGQILSYEPMYSNFKTLKENLALNDLVNVRAFNVAVTGNKNRVKIFHNKDQAAHTIYGKGDEYTEIDSTALKDILDSNHIQKCSLLKIDCEGAEYEIFASVTDEYFDRIDRICMEYHPIKNWDKLLPELISRLKLRYTVTIIPYSQGLGLLFANKQ